MKRLLRRAGGVMLAAFLFLCPCLVAQDFGRGLPTDYVDQGDVHRILVNSEDRHVIDQLRARGAVIRETVYPSFSLVTVTEASWNSREEFLAEGFDIRDAYDLIVFNGYRIHGRRPLEFVNGLRVDETYGDPAAISLSREAGLYVVQFEGPVKDAWLRALESMGAEVVQFVPSNGYVVRVRPAVVPMLEEYRNAAPELQYVGAYHPAYKLRPALRDAARRSADEDVRVTMQVVRSFGADALAQAEALMSTIETVHAVGPYFNIKGNISGSRLLRAAFQPAVFGIEPLGVRTRFDERQGQIIAGNRANGQPTGPGYLAWLASMGFDSSQFGSFSVNVVDDSPSLFGHPDLPNSRVAFNNNPTGQSSTDDGHGFLNAHIIAGFNNSTGAAFEDALGYNYGLGIAPWALVGTTAIFGSGNATSTSWENTAYSQGARISSNSWGFQNFQGPIPSYDANAQEYDFIVRDARSGVSGNQEYMVLFAASNDGPQLNTVSTPTTAKNVLSVGASENYRPTGTDGCGIGNSGADDLHDIISFSSRGPTDDGRWKPEIVAPGTHVQAGVPQSNYSGAGVCNAFWPSGQTLYGWSSGTSHSTPAVAGAAALVRQWFINNGMAEPSPAMTKAMLIGGAIYLTGIGANDTLPSNSQGMGLVNLKRSFDAIPRVLIDQSVVLGNSGASHQVTGSVGTSSKAFRVTLVWTDAPGTSTSSPWVNDLDLEVTVGGVTYKGNVFSGRHSTAGGNADFRNNVEAVYLPAGVTGAFTVTVKGTSIGGDGVPGSGDTTDQDFALVIHNGSEVALPPVSAFSGTPTSGSSPLTVNFTDQSSGTIASWLWNFGDGTTSTTPNPSHTYTTAGTYDVSLTVTGPAGNDTLTEVGYISVTPPPPPAAPSGLTANGVSTSQINLSWSDNDTNEDGFTIERSADGTNFVFHDTVGSNVTSYSDVGLTDNTTWWYRVQAFNSVGTSAFSNVADATTLEIGAVDYLATSDLGGQGTSAGSYLDTHDNDGQVQSITERLSGGKPVNRHSYLEQTWTFSVAPAGSLTFQLNAWHSPSSDGDDFVFAYSTDNVTFTDMVTVTDTSDTGSYLFYSLPANLAGTVYVRVTDTDQQRGNQGLDTVFIDDMVIAAAGANSSPPAAPDGLTATADTASSVALSWNDNAGAEDGFEIDRSTDGTNFSLIGTVGADVTTYADLGLTSGQTYYYRVRAFNGNGDSNWSNTAVATPGGSSAIDDFAQSESSIDGAIQAGSYLTTQSADGSYEQIREDRTGGPPSQRQSLLEHNFTFSVAGGSAVVFHLKAYKSASSDNDDFDFLYSVDGGSTFVPMLTVSNTSDSGFVTFNMPAATSGTVIVKVRDTDRTPGGGARDTIFIDQMFFRSQ